ncbi:hypothetical protein [Actinacidiphila glaucinigra]|uniref:hypothetical protein n=1 Tax=Actinacidiphila glaucinigra TaxID=235986 RepID=UPI003D9248EE
MDHKVLCRAYAAAGRHSKSADEQAYKELRKAAGGGRHQIRAYCAGVLGSNPGHGGKAGKAGKASEQGDDDSQDGRGRPENRSGGHHRSGDHGPRGTNGSAPAPRAVPGPRPVPSEGRPGPRPGRG